MSVAIVDGAAVDSMSPQEYRRGHQRRSVLVQLVRFGLVGGVIATLNTVIFLVTRVWWDALPANLVAVILSTAASTELNRRFTFRGARVRGRRLHVQTGIAVLCYAFSSSAALLVLHLLLTGGTTPAQESVAVSAAGVLAALGRFLLLRNWVFGRSEAVDVGALQNVGVRRPNGVDLDRVLFLTADTGGGHRAAAEAISQALHSRYPGRFVAVVCDPLTGSEAHRLLRRMCRWYGPLTRGAPWLWSVIFHVTNAPVTLWILRRLVRSLVVVPLVAALDRHRPTVVVSAHPLMVDAAVAARKRSEHHPSLVTVVTDLATAHRTWWHSQVDRTITPSDELLRAGRRAGAANVHGHPLGIPVREQFRSGSPPREGKATLQAMLGIRPGRFVVLVTAGAEGGRGVEVWVRTIVRGLPEVDVVAVCGRNESLRAELGEFTACAGGRLLVTGHVDTMSDWIRCADLVVTKAGPSIIAEATSVGVPLLLPSHIPGQERGNADIAVAAGAARRVRGRRHLIRQIDALRQDTAAMADMRAAATRFGRPHAAIRMAELVADAASTNADGSRIAPLRKKAR